MIAEGTVHNTLNRKGLFTPDCGLAELETHLSHPLCITSELFHEFFIELETAKK